MPCAGSDVEPRPGQVPQAALDQVAGDRRPDRLGDHEADTGLGADGGSGAVVGALGRAAPAGARPSGGRRSGDRAARPRGSERVRSGDCWRRARPAAHASGGEAVAALATTGGQDGAAGARAHAQAEAVGLVPTTVVRLERALAQRIHSTQGAGQNSPRTGSYVRDASPVASQLAPPTHEITRQGAVMDMRHRSTPDSTCQRYALRRDRVKPSGRRTSPPSRPAAGPPTRWAPALNPQAAR